MQLSIRKNILLAIVLLVVQISKAQVKLGTAATTFEKSALLELNGTRQGLLLPRLTDTSLINTLSPPDGMIIYYKPGSTGNGLYIRKTGYWQRLTTDSLLTANMQSWNLAGNNGLTGTEKLGTINAVPLNLVTSNINRITIAANGNTTITGNTTLGGTLSLIPVATTTDSTALFINASNIVVKRNLNNVAFNGAIQSINGLTASAQTLAVNPLSGTFAFSSTGSNHTLSIADADLSTRGFVNINAQSFAGNKTFSNNLTVSGVTTLSPASSTNDTSFLLINSSNQVVKRNFSTFPFGIQNLNGLTAAAQSFATSNTSGLSIGFTSTTSTHTLNIPDADATTRGVVNLSAQNFTGNKTFSNNLTVSGITSLTPAISTNDTSFLLINSSNQVVKRNFSTFPFGIQNLNGLTAATQNFAITNTPGAAVAFTSSGSTHSLNIPDADATTRGLVNLITQSFTGNKTFSNNLTVSGTTVLSPATTSNDTSFLLINSANQVVKRNFSTFPFGIQNLNGLTVSTQNFAITNTSGTAIGFTSTGATHSLNIPDADATTRGVVNLAPQTFTGNKTFSNNLSVSGTTTLSPTSSSADTSFLLINSSNQVVKRNFSTFPFGIQNLNGLTTQIQNFAITNTSGVAVGFTSSGSTHSLNIPDADLTTRGLVNLNTQSFTGNKTFSNNLTVSGTTILSPATSAVDTTFLLINSSNQVVKRNYSTFPGLNTLNGLNTNTQNFAISNTSGLAIGFTSSGSTHTLNIPDADASTRGVVNTTAQTFAGNKTFSNNLTVSGITALSPSTSTTDTSFLLINSSNQVVKRNLSTFGLGGIQSLNGLTTSTQTFSITNTASAAIGFNSSGSVHSLNIPDADASTRGVVTTGTQTFAGNKTYSGNLAISGITSLAPSASTTDTSFLLINGSNQVVKRNFSTFPFGIQNLNGLTTATQNFAITNTAGSAVGFTSSGSTHILNIPDADAITRGVVTTATQSFSGNKILSNNLTVSGTTTLTPAVSTTDTVFLVTNASNQVEKRNISSLPYIQNLNGLTSSTQTFAIANTPSTAIGFTSAGSTHTLNIPDADANTRGVVTTGAQTFAGAKVFNSTVTVNNTGSAGTSGLALPKLTSTTSETSGAKSIGVDASGNVVRTPTSPTYYNSAGVATITKVWIGQQNNSGGTITFNISSAGFSSITSVQATVYRATATAPSASYADITAISATSVTVKVFTGLTMILLGNSIIADTDNNTQVYLRVEGN